MILTIRDLFAATEVAVLAAESKPSPHGSDGERLTMCLRSARAALEEAVEMQRRIEAARPPSVQPEPEAEE